MAFPCFPHSSQRQSLWPQAPRKTGTSLGRPNSSPPGVSHSRGQNMRTQCRERRQAALFLSCRYSRIAVICRSRFPTPACLCAVLISSQGCWHDGRSRFHRTTPRASNTWALRQPLPCLLVKEEFSPLLGPHVVAARQGFTAML